MIKKQNKKINDPQQSKRVAEFDKITDLGNGNHRFLAIDFVDRDLTEKITFTNFTEIVTNDVAKANTFSITKTIDTVDSTQIIELKSELFRTKGITTKLYHGLQLKTDGYKNNVLPNNFQNYTNNIDEEPKCFLKFNNTDKKPLYNGKAYVQYGLLGLDYDTLWNKPMCFVYSENLDAWLVYKTPESFTWLVTEVNHDTTASGCGSRTITDVDVQHDENSLIGRIFGVDYVKGMADTTFAGASSLTPLNVISKGNVQSFGDSVNVVLTSATTNSSYWYSSNIHASSGIITQNFPTTDPEGTIGDGSYSLLTVKEGVMLKPIDIKYTIKPSIIVSGTTTGSQTLSARYGVYFQFVT